MPRIKHWKRKRDLMRHNQKCAEILKEYKEKNFLCDQLSTSQRTEELPPKKEVIVEVGPTHIQKKMMKDTLKEHMTAIGSKGYCSYALNNIRKCLLHPYLLSGDEGFLKENKLVKSCGKMILLDKLLTQLKKEGHKVIIYCSHQGFLEILEDYLTQNQHNYKKIVYSPKSLSQLQEACKRFDDPDGWFVFLLCKSLPISQLDLTAADTVIMYEGTGKRDMVKKVQSYCHRPGQTREVTVYRFLNSCELVECSNLDCMTAQNSKNVRWILKKAANEALTRQDLSGVDLNETLQKRSWTLQEGGAAFPEGVSTNSIGIDVQDPNFWKKWISKARLHITFYNGSRITAPRPKKRPECFIPYTDNQKAHFGCLPFDKSMCLYGRWSTSRGSSSSRITRNVPVQMIASGITRVVSKPGMCPKRKRQDSISDDNEGLHCDSGDGENTVHGGEEMQENSGVIQQQACLTEKTSAELPESVHKKRSLVARSTEEVSYEDFLSSVLKQCKDDEQNKSCHLDVDKRKQLNDDSQKHSVGRRETCISTSKISENVLIKMAQNSKVKVSLCRLPFNKDSCGFDGRPGAYQVVKLKNLKRGRQCIPDDLQKKKKKLQSDKVMKKGRPKISDGLKRKKMKDGDDKHMKRASKQNPTEMKKKNDESKKIVRRGKQPITDHLKGKNRKNQSENKKIVRKGKPSIPDHLKRKNRKYQSMKEKHDKSKQCNPDHLKKKKRLKAESHELQQSPGIEIEWDRAEESDEDNYAECAEMDSPETASYGHHEDNTNRTDFITDVADRHPGNFQEAQERMETELHVTGISKSVTERFFLNGKEVDLDKMLNSCRDYTPESDTSPAMENSATHHITPNLFPTQTPVTVISYPETRSSQNVHTKICTSEVRTSACIPHTTHSNQAHKSVPSVISYGRDFYKPISAGGTETIQNQIPERVDSKSAVKSRPIDTTLTKVGDFEDNPIVLDCDNVDDDDDSITEVSAVVVTPPPQLAASNSNTAGTDYTPVPSCSPGTAYTGHRPGRSSSDGTVYTPSTPVLGFAASVVSDTCPVVDAVPSSNVSPTKERTGDIHFHLMDPATRAMSTITLSRSCTQVVLLDRSRNSNLKIPTDQTDIRFSATQGEVLTDFVSKNLKRISMSGPSVFFLEMHESSWLNLVSLVNRADSAFVHSLSTVHTKVKRLINLLDHQLKAKVLHNSDVK